ncbi:MAG: hypothetical protein JXA92_02030 [candidate division Zixibacteria bacterium]|nr:hypothetical protein [candidate division Zixibacteria bacterium]
MILTAAACEADEHRCEILQYKLDRLYFSAGEEADIFSHSSFKIVCGSDTLYRGWIDQSIAGVSYSDTTGGFFDSVDLSSCFALIATAENDSLAVIIVHFQNMADDEIKFILSDNIAAEEDLYDTLITEDGRGLLISKLDVDDIVTSYQAAKEYDIQIAYDSQYITVFEVGTISASAPYIAVLMPNLAKNSSAGGVLTTSLYYNFSGFLLPHLFDGDNPLPAYSLFAEDGTSRRPYVYDPGKGRELYRGFHDRPGELSLYYSAFSLRKVADYFADILAREKIKVNISDTDHDADLILTYIPTDNQKPQKSLRYLYELLSKTETFDASRKETLTIIGNYLEAAEEAEKPETVLNYCSLADRGFIHDLGVFPLFRPLLYVTFEKNIKNCGFDASGRLDVYNVTKLVMPTENKETDR